MHHNFKELNVWKEAKDFSISVYKVTMNFTKSEVYGITSQINRAAVSISSNIAEGAGRNSNKDFARFVHITLGSSFELETQLIIALELNFIEQSSYNSLIEKLNKIQKMLVNLNKHLQK